MRFRSNDDDNAQKVVVGGSCHEHHHVVAAQNTEEEKLQRQVRRGLAFVDIFVRAPPTQAVKISNK